MRSFLPRSFVVAAVVVATLAPATGAQAFTDVTSSYWDYGAIKYVAIDHTWMRDYGSSTFKPATRELRKYLARSLVQAFAPGESVDTRIHFPDLADDDPFYPFANVAAKLGWMPKFASGNWGPDGYVPVSMLDYALVSALGLRSAISGLAAIHEADGDRYSVGERFPHQQLAAWLGLHYNHSTESLDLQSSTLIKRDEVAYSLWAAKAAPSWKLSATSRFDDIALGALTSTTRHQLFQFALQQVGYPYIWGGEWNAASPPGYCCGSQPQGGFDCSGFVWWVIKRYEDGYNAAAHRPYDGWSIHERTSSTMAQYAPSRISFGNLQEGQLMFFASDGVDSWSHVDHVGIYAGNGWMIHSTDGGPQLEWVGDGWYRDHFVWGRGLSTKSSTPSPTGSALLAGESA